MERCCKNTTIMRSVPPRNPWRRYSGRSQTAAILAFYHEDDTISRRELDDPGVMSIMERALEDGCCINPDKKSPMDWVLPITPGI